MRNSNFIVLDGQNCSIWGIIDSFKIYFINARERAKTLHDQPFGRGTGQVYMNGVECQGNESSILQCYHRGWGNHVCDHSKDVSVNCTSYSSMFHIYHLYLQHLQALSISVRAVSHYSWQHIIFLKFI